MQPAQLSLLTDRLPAPAPMVLAGLPDHDVDKAIKLLGSLIVKASAIDPGEMTPADATEVGADE